MDRICLVCPKCNNRIDKILEYTEKHIVAHCSVCGNVEWTFKEQSYKPQETKRKLTNEHYFTG